MTMRADAHMHLFAPGYVDVLPEPCRRAQPDELTLYAALAQQHQIAQALVVGYEGGTWAAGNNRYIAGLAAAHAWIRPLAFCADARQLSEAALEQLERERFVGLSFYPSAADYAAMLEQAPAEIWRWLEQRRWILSVNAHGALWHSWAQLLGQYPDLRLLAAHLGLPPAVAQAPSATAARQALAPVLELARLPHAYVKLSGFYALAEPHYSYPHRAAWPYVEQLLEAFGAERLLWGSDFSPSLEWVSFPQTIGVLDEMPFLDDTSRQRIAGANLRGLLAQVPA